MTLAVTQPLPQVKYEYRTRHCSSIAIRSKILIEMDNARAEHSLKREQSGTSKVTRSPCHSNDCWRSSSSDVNHLAKPKTRPVHPP